MNRTFKQRVIHPPLATLFSSRKKTVFQQLLSQTNGYFEYGCGGSTWIASQYLNKQICSVESDRDWVDKVREHCPVATVQCIDIGPTKEFGYPVDESCKSQWPAYSEAWKNTNPNLELVLIDGRFRVACAAMICLYPKGVKSICFDDYMDRPQYHVIKPFVEIIQTVDTMIVCRPKHGVDREALQNLYDEYKYNPA